MVVRSGAKLEGPLVVGDDLDSDEPVLLRVHSECLTGDAFHSRRCDCGDQLERAMAVLAETGRGVILYLRQERRGIGLLEKVKAYISKLSQFVACTQRFKPAA